MCTKVNLAKRKYDNADGIADELLNLSRVIIESRTIPTRSRHAKTKAKEKLHTAKRVKEEPALISITCKNAIKKAVDKLQAGKVIAIPTDTVYGFACSANNPKAIRQLYDIKGRDELKPVAICVATVKQLQHCGEAEHLEEQLLEDLLQEAVTIVIKRKTTLNPMLNPEEPNIGIRIINYGFVQDVCKEFQQPIALTSANKSSSKSTLNIREFEDLWPYLGAVFNGGQLSLSDEQRVGSTVIDLSVSNFYKIIRAGVSVERIIKIVKKYNIRLASEFPV
ncbi:threonylcarbamoyl-AMP synthase [Anopheles marshallii]|uniref:threonylcarbamoyl-AMP synthase n=1 Tax=Anopheles marshallii TaxID=1521116 RepID=UPI00237B6DB7|nr:threonylcarbamoyl-AMP synthase [Anopheles marshallii]